MKVGYNKGFSSLEMLIVLVISALTIIVIYTFYGYQEKTYSLEEQEVEKQQNSRIALEMIQKDLLSAGTGSNLCSFLGNTGLILPGYGGGNGNPDSITAYSPIAQPFSTLLVQPMPNPSSEFKVADVSGFTGWENGKGIICDGINYQWFTITQVKTEDKIIQHSDDYPIAHQYNAGAQIILFKGKEITYSINTSTPLHPKLIKETVYWNTPGKLGNSFGAQPTFEDIESLQFHYTLPDGTITQNPADFENIQAIKVTLIAKSRNPDSRYNKGDNPLTSNVEMDGYRRMVLSTTAKPRNMR